MSIRDKLKRHPKASASIGVATLAIGIGYLVIQLFGGGGAWRRDGAFFTTDDGATTFVDSADRIPPFPHDGKEAVRAYVFECGGKRFVNHLERFTPERQKLAQAAADALKAGKSPPRPPASAGQTVNWGIEFKKPGGKEWVAGGNLAKASRLLQAKCPDGHDALPVQP
jgi:hypothetical protein